MTPICENKRRSKLLTSNLRGSETFLGELTDVLLDLSRCLLQPHGGRSLVRQRGAANAFSSRVHTTHIDDRLENENELGEVKVQHS